MSPAPAEFAVALGNPDESDFNTVVLGGVDISFPLEADLDGDPLHDDELRLLRIGGGYDEVLFASDDDARHDAEKNLYIYTFREVPFGCYDLLVRIGDQKWVPVISGLRVAKTGVKLGELTLQQEEAKPAPRNDESEPPDSGEEDSFAQDADGLPRYSEAADFED